MEPAIDHFSLEAALQRCGASWDAAQTHGLLSGQLAIAGAHGGFDWLERVLDGTDPNDAMRTECEVLLSRLFETTLQQLSNRQSEFMPLLPDDEQDTAVRASALAHWCEGFLHGLVTNDHGEALKKRLADEPLADIIKDMLQITRAEAQPESDDEADEQAYAELVEYVRVAVQLAFEELVEFRHASGEGRTVSEAEVLH